MSRQAVTLGIATAGNPHAIIVEQHYSAQIPPTGEQASQDISGSQPRGWRIGFLRADPCGEETSQNLESYEEYVGSTFEYLSQPEDRYTGCVDPAFLEPHPGYDVDSGLREKIASFEGAFPPPSPALERCSLNGNFPLVQNFQPYSSRYDEQLTSPTVRADIPDWSFVRRSCELPHRPEDEDCPSMTTGSTIGSRNSSTRSARSFRGDSNGSRETGMCPYPHCARVFRDLAAHMLTHQSERPEKCPVEDCEYHVKGFARAYDRVRHTVTHFKGTMACNFCSGVGTSTGKLFNRCDVFLRHLSSVHGAQRECSRTAKIKAPRRPSQDQNVATCSLCSEPFDIQGFFEHLSGCVLRQVTRTCAKPQEQKGEVRAPLHSLPGPSKENLAHGHGGFIDARVQGQHHAQESMVEVVEESLKSRCYSESPDAPREMGLSESPDSKEIMELTASSRCLSLTSSVGDGATKSSDEETDWTEDAGSPASELDAYGLRPMLSPIKRQLVDTIMAEFHRLFDDSLRSRNGGSVDGGGAGNGSNSGFSSGSSTYSTSSFISRKRSLSGGSSPPDDNGDDPNKRRRPDPKSSIGKQPTPDQRFACPYYKRNPGRYQTFTSCRDPGFITVARLKEHLYRRHSLPIQCNRCCATFPNEPTLREHQRDPRGCEVREQIPLEGFDKDQERKLKSKKRSLVYQSEEDKWKGVYRILFPDDNEADMPSPYIEYQSCNTHYTSESSNIVRFQEFTRLELPRLVRRTLEIVVEEEAQPLEDKLKERLVDIVRDCQTQLISLFQQASGAQNLQTSELTSNLIVANSVSQQPSNVQNDVPFENFDSFTADTLATDFIRIPVTDAQDDSGYDSTWTSAAFSYDTSFPEDPTYQQQRTFTSAPTLLPPHSMMNNSHDRLSGYYGLFENRELDYVGGADTSWVYLDSGNPTTAANGIGHNPSVG